MEGSNIDPLAAASQIDLRYYLRLFWRRRWFVLAVMVSVIAAVAFYTLRQPKVYQAMASVIIDVTAPRVLDSQVQDVTDNGGSANYWFNREYYETQNRVITSRAVSSRVAEKLGLQNDPAFLGLDAIKDPKAREEAMRGADAAGLLQSKIKVVPVKDSRLVNIAVEDLDPQRAALLANEVADAYIAENLAHKLRQTENASKWLEERLVELDTRARKGELAVYDFKKSQDMLSTSIEDRASMIAKQLDKYTVELTDVRTRMAGLKARVEAINHLRDTAKSDAGSRWAESLPGADGTLIQALKLRFVNQRSECIELAERYLPDHPKLAGCLEKQRAYEGDLVHELNNIVRIAENELTEATAKERNLMALLATAKADAFDVNKKQIEYAQLKRDSDNNQRLYELVLKRLKDIELSGMLRTSNVRVLDPARPVFGPIRPNVRSWLMLAVLAGLLGGLGLAVLLEFVDNTITSQVDVEQRLGVPFLGFVPTIEPDKGTELRPVDLYIHRNPKSTVAESCRAVRTNLLFMSPDKPFKTMVVSSAGPQEGKSATVINLGIAMAQSGNRILLLDTDMRRPRLHKAFGVPNDAGISSVVVGEGTLADAIKSTEVPGLFVLPCGPIPPNPAELLHTRTFNDVLTQLCQQFDRVILDSPPIGAVADAVVLSTRADGVVLVVKAGVTNREMARRSVRALADVNAKLFGVVLNHIDLQDPKYGGYYAAYSKYGYYYGEKKDEALS